MNRLDEAAADYTAALRFSRGSGLALNNRANIFRRQRRFKDANRDYLASLAGGNPAPEYPYYGLGQVAESQGLPDKAREYYRRAVAANPGYTPAVERLMGLGDTLPARQIVVLKSPATDAPLILHPPGSRQAPPADNLAYLPAIRPAAYAKEDQPALRPALNNSVRSPGGQEIQLGAWRSDAEAAESWNRTVKEAAGALSGLVPKIVPVDLPGKGRYYRLRVETADARQLCATLAGLGLDCMPVRD